VSPVLSSPTQTSRWSIADGTVGATAGADTNSAKASSTAQTIGWTTAGTAPAWSITACSFTPYTPLAVVQHKEANSTDTAITEAVTVTSTGTNNLLVVGAYDGGTRTITGVSDGTNNFTQATSAADAQSNQASDVWYLLKSTSGTTTITVTYSGSVGASFEKDVNFWEVSGFTNAAFDVANNLGGVGAGVGTTDTGASVTTATTNGFVVGQIGTAAAITQNPKTGNEFTAGGDNGNSSAGASLISITQASHTPVWLDSASGRILVSSTAAFKEGTASTTVTPNLTLAFLGVG
jgi:hypothetical protein